MNDDCYQPYELSKTKNIKIQSPGHSQIVRTSCKDIKIGASEKYFNML